VSRNTGKAAWGKERDIGSKSKKGHSGGAIKVTSRLSVERLEILTSLPSTWAVPRDRSATLVDLSGREIPSKRNGEEYTIDGFIRAEVRIQNVLHLLLVRFICLILGSRLMGRNHWPFSRRC
jgi:hypothetical protein